MNIQTILNEATMQVGKSFSYMTELEEYLSSRFQKILENEEDAQAGFDELDSELDGFLGKYFCYTLSEKGSTWNVATGDSFNASELSHYIESFEGYYNESFQTVEDLVSKLESRVHKDMSNVGCDAKTALRLLLEDDLFLADVFRIEGADAEPRIEYVEFEEKAG